MYRKVVRAIESVAPIISPQALVTDFMSVANTLVKEIFFLFLLYREEEFCSSVTKPHHERLTPSASVPIRLLLKTGSKPGVGFKLCRANPCQPNRHALRESAEKCSRSWLFVVDLDWGRSSYHFPTRFRSEFSNICRDVEFGLPSDIAMYQQISGLRRYCLRAWTPDALATPSFFRPDCLLSCSYPSADSNPSFAPSAETKVVLVVLDLLCN